MKIRLKSLVTLIILISLSQNCAAQLDSVWSMVYGGTEGEQAMCGYETPDRGVLIGGWSWTEGYGWDMAMLKISQDGDSLWYRKYRKPEDNFIYSMASWFYGGYLMVGTTHSAERQMTITSLVAIDGNGEVAWDKEYGSEECYTPDVALDENADFHIMGMAARRTDGPFNQWDAMIMKVSARGDSLWTRYYGEEELDEYTKCGTRLSGGGFALAGSLNIVVDDTVRRDLLVMKMDRDGDLEWTQTFGQPRIYEYANCITQMQNGNLAIGGSFYSLEDHRGDGFCAIVSLDGDSLAFTPLGSAAPDYIKAIVPTDDGGVICSGALGDWDMNYQFWNVGISAEGEFLWQTEFGGRQWDMCWGSTWLSDGSLLMMGETQSFGHVGDVISDGWLVKAKAPDGIKPWQPEPELPDRISLISVYPSPFNSRVMVAYSAPSAGLVRTSLIDLNGRETGAWSQMIPYPGEFKFTIDGNGLSAGVYWVKVSQGGQSAMQRVVLLR